MTKVDLITGFLGAGKTTFIHKYLKHLAGQKVLVIENEFGSVSVDTSFLKEDGCDIEDLAGVCMCCKGRGQFINMLSDASAHGYDRVLVEPSGIYDVDEFFNTMNDVQGRCEVGCVLTIVDAQVPESLTAESAYLMVSQLLAAGTVILSKAQRSADPAATIAWLNGLIRENGGARVLSDDVFAADWDALTDADFERFMASGYRQEVHARQVMNHGEIYSSFLTADRCLDEQDLTRRVQSLMTEPRFGNVLRAKGYVRDFDKNWYEVNCTRDDLSVRPAPNVRRGILVVIGQDLDEAALRQAFLPRNAR